MGQFYNFITDDGNKMVNVNNIAAIEDLGFMGIEVTLNVAKEKGVNISFKCKLDWAGVTAAVKFKDDDQMK